MKPQARFLTSRLWLFALFGGVAGAFAIMGLPGAMSFPRYAFADQGENFALDYLIVCGLRPEVDFAYHYGLLSLMLGRLLFSIWGYTPAAYELAMLVTTAVISWAIATIASCQRFRWLAITLTAVAMPIAAPTIYSNLAQCAEASLLSLGLAKHSQGNRQAALVFATASCFAKPAMGYVYGLLLILLIARQWRQARGSLYSLAWQMAPALAVGLVLATALMMIFGFEPLMHTLVPVRAADAYRAAGYGFFGPQGRLLLHPPNAGIGYYISNIPAGFWIIATLWIFWRGSASALRLLRERGNDVSVELVASIAAMQAMFVFVMFGNNWSWFYYSYLLGVGAALSITSSGAIRGEPITVTMGPSATGVPVGAVGLNHRRQYSR